MALCPAPLILNLADVEPIPATQVVPLPVPLEEDVYVFARLAAGQLAALYVIKAELPDPDDVTPVI